MRAIQTTSCASGVTKPDGGYRLIRLSRLYAAWWHYREGILRFVDLRIYFALEEMAARRCRTRKGITARYTLAELGKLVGVESAKTLSASLKRLEQAGLSTWNETSAQSHREFCQDFEHRLSLIPNHRRKIPVPRRTLRWIAIARRPVLVATVLGHLFRCVYARGLYVGSKGCISASWVARVFDVDTRNVKRANAQLRALNWLSVLESNHWHRQRYGQTVVVNLRWSTTGAKSPLRTPQKGFDLPPPESDRKLPKGFTNQKPAAPGSAGVTNPVKSVPSLDDVQVEDLRDTGRILALFVQAQTKGLVGASESERLRFVGAAVRAASRATRQPGGFFCRLVRDRLWHHITSAEEDQARTRLRRHLHETHSAREAHLPIKTEIVPSADVRFVAHVVANLRKHGYAGDPYDAVSQHDPRWTRDRWNQAIRAWINRRGTQTPENRKLPQASPPHILRPFHLMAGGVLGGPPRGQGGTVGEEAPRTRGVVP